MMMPVPIADVLSALLCIQRSPTPLAASTWSLCSKSAGWQN